jgi:hypothetical protein|tara:strand:+ start:3083 stop:3286 length:204 start_codon:yes stop_codon:yes gene_type:complete
MTTPSQADLLTASVIQALLDIREELFQLNKSLERVANTIEEKTDLSVKDVNTQNKKFFSRSKLFLER